MLVPRRVGIWEMVVALFRWNHHGPPLPSHIKTTLPSLNKAIFLVGVGTKAMMSSPQGQPDLPAAWKVGITLTYSTTPLKLPWEVNQKNYCWDVCRVVSRQWGAKGSYTNFTASSCVCFSGDVLLSTLVNHHEKPTICFCDVFQPP